MIRQPWNYAGNEFLTKSRLRYSWKRSDFDAGDKVVLEIHLELKIAWSAWKEWMRVVSCSEDECASMGLAGKGLYVICDGTPKGEAVDCFSENVIYIGLAIQQSLKKRILVHARTPHGYYGKNTPKKALEYFGKFAVGHEYKNWYTAW